MFVQLGFCGGALWENYVLRDTQALCDLCSVTIIIHRWRGKYHSVMGHVHIWEPQSPDCNSNYPAFLQKLLNILSSSFIVGKGL